MRGLATPALLERYPGVHVGLAKSRMSQGQSIRSFTLLDVSLESPPGQADVVCRRHEAHDIGITARAALAAGKRGAGSLSSARVKIVLAARSDHSREPIEFRFRFRGARGHSRIADVSLVADVADVLGDLPT